MEETSNRSAEKGGMSTGSTYFTKKMRVDYMEEFYKFSEEEDISQSKSELDVYLEEKPHPRKNSDEDDDDFSILQWLKANSSKFQVHSRMAHDILAILVSSVASQSAFSTGGRVLSKFCSSLLPSTVEALVYAQDWIRGEPIQIEFEEEVDTAFTGA